MKWMNFWTICLLLSFSLTLRAESTPKLDLTVEVTSFRITHVGEDRVEAEVGLGVNTGIDATIDHIEFANVHANNVPFFAKPVSTTIDLHHGQQTALPPISVAVYYNDLDSLGPIIEMLQQRRANLKGEIAFSVHAGRIERLFLRTAHPQVVAPIDRSIEVQSPSGELERRSAIALLTVAQAGLSGGKTLEQAINRTGAQWKPQPEAARYGLLHSQSCYTMVQKKIPTTTCLDQLSFLLAPQQAISSAELGAPWKYDPAIARSLAHGGAKLQADAPAITVRPGVGAPSGETGSASAAQPPTAASFQQNGTAAPLLEIVLPDHAETTVLERDAPGLYGRLELQSAMPRAGFQLAPSAVRNQTQWDQLAVYRLVRTGDDTWKVVMITLSGTVKDGTVSLSRSVDRSAIGSPILTPAGIIGVVQSETAGTLLSNESAP